MFVTVTLEVQLTCVPQTKKNGVHKCVSARPIHWKDSVGVCQVVVSVSSCSHTYNVKLSRHLLWAKTVGDLAGIAAAVLLPQVADGQPCQTPCPAGIWGQRATIFQPANGGAGVTSRDARELNTLASIHLPCLKTVQDGGWRLVGVCGGRDGVTFFVTAKRNITKS